MASGHASARVIPFIDTAKTCAFVSCQSHKGWWLTILGILGGFAALAGDDEGQETYPSAVRWCQRCHSMSSFRLDDQDRSASLGKSLLRTFCV
jgi:hypothetical protein